MKFFYFFQNQLCRNYSLAQILTVQVSHFAMWKFAIDKLMPNSLPFLSEVETKTSLAGPPTTEALFGGKLEGHFT